MPTKKTVTTTVVKNESKKTNGANTRSRRRRRGNGGGGGDAPVSSAVAVTSRANAKVKLSGTDRIAHIGTVGGMAEGSLVIDIPLTCSDIPRLQSLSKAYQRVVFEKLVFRVVPMSSTANSGGYVTAFVPDVRDEFSGGTDALNRIVAQAGAKIAKIWQSTVVTHRCVRDVLYTSIPPRGELRLSSPGRFVLALESDIAKEGDKIPISVYLDWTVTLMDPSLETESPMNQVLTSRASFYLRSQNFGLWHNDGDGGSDPTKQIPGIARNVIYRLPSKRFVDFSGGGDPGTVQQVGNFDRVILTTDKTHGLTLWVVGYDGNPIKEKPSTNQWFLEAGDTLTPEPKNLKVVLQSRSRVKSTEPPGELPEPSFSNLKRSDSNSSIETIYTKNDLMRLMRR